MTRELGSQRHLFPRPSAAIYDTPKIVSARLSQVLAEAGFDVVFEGPLTEKTARSDVQVWVAKWTFLFKKEFLSRHRPSKGIVTLSVGTDHMDLKTISELGLKVENCPSFSSNSVAEHAMALAMRSLYPGCVLPALHHRPIIFTRFSDSYAEQAVAQMLMRSRQLEDSIGRAKRSEYYREDEPDYRHDEPWTNTELGGTKVGIVGSDREATELARLLKLGFNCELFTFDTTEELDVYNPKHLAFHGILDVCDYIFLCTEGYGLQKPSVSDVPTNPSIVDFRLKRIDSPTELSEPVTRLSKSNVAVLGTGNIGSIIARMARLGFGCEVSAFSRTPRPDLTALGVSYKGTVGEAIHNANFIFIALPLNDGTRSLIGWEQLVRLPYDQARILVNVTRDQIIESEALYSFMIDGGLYALATDAIPNDAKLWSRGSPDELTRKFVQHPRVIATPHEGDCSAPSLDRMCGEATGKALKIIGDS